MVRIDCKLCVALKEVDADDKEALTLALNTGSVQKTDIAAIMTRNGYPMSEAAVRRHIINHKGKK